MMDLIVVGGGLAGGLLAGRLLARRADLDFVVLEAASTLGGNHTWSFHDSDVTTQQLAWLSPFIGHSWSAHDVAFPTRQRTLQGGYHSVRSEDFHRELSKTLGSRVRLGVEVATVTKHEVRLANGDVLRAPCVIDARGFAAINNGPCGYQKFLGLDVTLEQPHGLTHPLLMDARVVQHDGYRFVYLLPWSERSLLVEDTYYSDTATIDRETLRARVDAYLASRGWKIEAVHREESAALPIPLDARRPSLAMPTIGVRAGFFHATTGYSLPVAARVADAISELRSLDTRSVSQTLTQLANVHWKEQSFFRLLNRLLFEAVDPNGRRGIFESFYGHDDALIAHFYAGHVAPAEILRVLARGSRTVDLLAAMRAAIATRRV